MPKELKRQLDLLVSELLYSVKDAISEGFTDKEATFGERDKQVEEIMPTALKYLIEKLNQKDERN